jgi:hypothetical protein
MPHSNMKTEAQLASLFPPHPLLCEESCKMRRRQPEGSGLNASENAVSAGITGYRLLGIA